MSGAAGDEPAIALVLSADEWVDHLHRYCADHGGARVRCVIVDPALALDEEFDVLVSSARWPALTRPFVDALHDRGRRVLVVADDPGEMELGARVGVDACVPAETVVPDLVARVVTLVPPDGRAGDPPVRLPRPGAGDRPRAGGPIVAVGGPFGAGSTEVAIMLSAVSARAGHPAVLVDADDVTPSVAARLGLPLEPNLCTAVDAVAYGLGALPGTLFDLGDDWPAVLVGAPGPDAAAGLRGSEVVAVGAALAERFAPVVVDVSAGLRGRDGPELAVTLVGAATAVVAVGAANPVGVVRLADWLTAMGRGGALPPVHVVVNRAPAARRRRAEIAGEIQRSLRVAGLSFVPADPRVEDAVWDASIPERGPFVRALTEVRDTVIGAVTP